MPTGSRVAKIELKTSAAGVDAGLRESSRKLRQFKREQESQARKAEREGMARARRVVRAIDREQEAADRDRSKRLGRAGGAIGGMVKGAAMGLGAAAGFDIAGALGGAVSEVFDFEKELTRLSIDANLSARTVGQVRDQMMAVSNATGVSRLELVKAAHAYQILTGDAQGAIVSTKDFADVAIAAGAAPQEIAEAAASMRKNLDLDPKDFRKGFDVLLNLGHKGALELRDFAGEMSGVAPQFKEFGSADSLTKLTELGAALETVKLNFKDSAETATGMRAAMAAISKSKVAERLAGAGVQIWTIDPKTKEHVKRDFFDIIADIKKKVPDQKVLADILGGRQESFRAITAMLEHFDEMQKLRAEAANSDQVSVDAHKYLESSTGKLERAWEQIKNSIAGALTPERVQAFADAIIAAARGFAAVIGGIDHTFQGWDRIWSHLHGQRTDQEAANFRDERRKSLEMGAGANAMGAAADMVGEDILQHRLEAQVQGVDWTKLGDEAMYGNTKGAHLYSPQEIQAFAGRAGTMSNFDSLAPVLLRAFTQALQGATIVVKADSNAIATTGKNAPINRGSMR
jgi:TP901 family phage tail tape measure protein